MSLFVTLPLPPSVNHSHRPVRRISRSGKVYTSKSPTPKLRRWRTDAWVALKAEMREQGWRCPAGGVPVVVELSYFWPDERRRDTHNRIKEVMDALQQAGVVCDDRWTLAHERSAEVDRERPRVELSIHVEQEP